jgi:hypothetical protein
VVPGWSGAVLGGKQHPVDQSAIRDYQTDRKQLICRNLKKALRRLFYCLPSLAATLCHTQTERRCDATLKAAPAAFLLPAAQESGFHYRQQHIFTDSGTIRESQTAVF